MAVWGKKLSSPTLRAVDEANSAQGEEDVLEGVQSRLLLSAKATLDRSCSPQQFGLLMDCPPVRPPTPVVPAEPMEVEIALNLSEVTENIVRHVENRSNDINVIIELVSNLNDEQLSSVVDGCAKRLDEDESKRSLIVAMSATRNAAVIVSSRVLRPAFSGEENFPKSLDLYGSVLGWLESSVVEATVVPLLMDRESSLNRVHGQCKALFEALTDSQKSETLAKFSNRIDNDLQDWQLQTLSVVLEYFPADNAAVAPLTSMLASNIAKFTDDRLMGKIILSAIGSLSPTTTPPVLSAVTTLVGSFKGSLRFRHKKALDKVVKSIQPS